jgi:predicted glycoside hydrolase/deacetylase ChbG (UPF0249 family)
MLQKRRLRWMRLLINADDLGISRSANESIFACHDSGPINGASLLVNGDDVDFAVGECQRRPNLDVGLHINLCEGYPISPVHKVDFLVGADGRLRRGFSNLLASTLISRPRQKQRLEQQIGCEIEAQVNRFRALLRKQSAIRVDCHIHVSAIPAVMRVLVALAKRGLIDRVRVPIERAVASRSLSLNGIKQVILWGLTQGAPERFEGLGVQTVSSVAGIVYSGGMHEMGFESLALAIRRAQGDFEVICHPGGMTRGEAAKSTFRYFDFYLSQNRERERDHLIRGRSRYLKLISSHAHPI